MLYFNPLIFSNSGAQNSSVTPGYSVDSKITISSFLRYLDIVLQADSISDRSGFLSSVIGVGTVNIEGIDFRQISMI